MISFLYATRLHERMLQMPTLAQTGLARPAVITLAFIALSTVIAMATFARLRRA